MGFTDVMGMGKAALDIANELKNTELKDILEELSEREDVVPTIYLKRIKTDKYYYTFCSPEASQKIAYYLIIRCHNKYDVNERLFDIDYKLYEEVDKILK